MWTTPLWSPPQDLSPAEEKIAARAVKKKKLFVFLRAIRTELLDQAFQEELAEMYRQTGAGKPPLPPALLAMATLLQAYTRVSEQEAVELTLDSKRWQLVLDGLGAEEPLFSQGALFDFRMRRISTGMDQRLLERTVELARARGGFEAKALRLALDSSPLWGHGRVEDTFNLLGHAAHQVIACLAELTRHEVAHVLEQIGLSLFEAPSLKAALDINWDDAEQKQQALQRLCDELEALQNWIREHLPVEVKQPPLAAALETLQTLMAQDLEPDPTDGGTRIREGVAKDRRISIEDDMMRHGRKSATTRFDGYKRHLGRDIDEQLILAAEVFPANTPDTAGLDPLLVAVELQHREVTSLHIDRGYLGDPLINIYDKAGVVIVCKPWPVPPPAGHFSKLDFQLDLMTLQATCPAGQVIPITLGKTVHFPAATCQGCPQRAQCTSR
ncbi:MAG TPA: transposase, partial [Candidatus Competibacteraceae bacterium]|nr:transposase [Candidatus Competibacteraceae bacterium]